MLKRIDKILTDFEEVLNGSFLIAATLLLFVNIVLRYFFHSATTWAEEAIRYAMIWITFFGGSICARNKMHVGIDIFAQMAPPVLKKIMLVTAQLSAALFTALLTIYSFELTMLLVETSQKSPALMMPMWIVYVSMPLGGALMTIRFIVAAYKVYKEKPDDVEADELDLSRL